MKPDYKHIQYFLIPYFAVFSILTFFVATMPKYELHLAMIANRSLFADYFFKIWTEFGASFPYFIIAGLFFWRYSAGVFLVLSQSLGGLLSFVIKNIFKEPRPKLYFQLYHPEIVLPVVPGVKLWSTNSFPSGHTITAFALFFGIALTVKNKWLKFACFIAAALVGYSRIYLSQHFAIDVLCGSLIGIISAWIFYPVYQKIGKKWKNHSLSEVFERKNI